MYGWRVHGPEKAGAVACDKKHRGLGCSCVSCQVMEKICHVCLGKAHQYTDYHYVASDHHREMADCMRHLLELGHRKIGVIVGENSINEKTHKEAYLSELMAWDVGWNPDYYCLVNPYGGKYNQDNLQKCRRLLLQEDAPTAVVSIGVAVPLIEQIAAEEGIAIPSQLSLVALDHSPDMAAVRNYTHVASRSAEVATLAFKKLLRSIHNPAAEFTSEVVPLTLNPGESTCAPTIR